MGKYYVFEGPDGIGKTTLAKNFAERIGAKFTYEPFGHTPETKMLRERALTKDVPKAAREYLLLANRDLGYQDLKKWLYEGDVVSDRSLLSGMIYAFMEGFAFDVWLDMARPILYQASLSELIVILCSNEEYKNKLDPNDRYDGRGNNFHNTVGMKFLEGVNYLSWPHIPFKIDFNRSKEENLEALILQLSYPIRK